MRAFFIDEYKPDAMFRVGEMFDLELKPGHVIIEVRATSLNPADSTLRQQDLGINPQTPAVLHMDVAGVITAVADDVYDFVVGDEVYGCAGGVGEIDGALAEYMLADARLIALKPKSLNFEEAAALPLVSITAWDALFNKVADVRNKSLLVQGGTGGVGHIAVQLARFFGAHVTTTVSSLQKSKLAYDLGAHEVVYYKEESVEEYVERITKGHGFDIVLDTVGGSVLDESFVAARPNGDVVTLVSIGAHDLSNMHFKSLSLHVVFMLLPMLTGEGREAHGRILKKVADLVDAGEIRPLLDEKRFSFGQAHDAHQHYLSGKHIGKIVLFQGI